MHIFLDIETIPAQGAGAREEIAAAIAPPGNYKKVETIAEWEREQKPALVEEAWRKTALDGALGQVACAALAVDDAPPAVFYEEDWARAEPRILRGLFDAIRAAHDGARMTRPVFVGHNIAGFDLRFLFQRAVLHGIEPPAVIPFSARPWEDCIFDTMTAWAGYGNRVGLDKLCRALGLPGKGAEIGAEIDGGKVWDFVADGRIAEVAEYCKGDVERARRVPQTDFCARGGAARGGRMLILREGNTVLVGLSRRNIALLLEGNPIRFDGAEAGLPGVAFRIFAGQAEPAPRVPRFLMPADMTA